MKKTICVIEEIVLQMRQAEDGAWENVNRHFGQIVSAMEKTVKWAESLIQGGEDFPMDVVLQQIQNFNEAYEAKDEVMLADTLEYEIKNTLLTYIEEGENRYGL